MERLLIDKLYLTAMTEVIDEDKSRKIIEAVEYLSIDDDRIRSMSILNHGRKNVMAAMELNKS